MARMVVVEPMVGRWSGIGLGKRQLTGEAEILVKWTGLEAWPVKSLVMKSRRLSR